MTDNKLSQPAMRHRRRFVHLAMAAMLAVVFTLASTSRGSTAPTEEALFAGGCFWCTEAAFDETPGVLSATSGYTGGRVTSPSYEQVSSGQTGHAESVRVVYDPAKISYAQLLTVFWHNIDPLDAGGQFCDRGSQYRAAIFYENDEQKRLAEQSKEAIDKSGRFNKPVVTEITAASEFYPAEDYHQDYYLKNPLNYRSYRVGCGRDRRLKELWGDEAGKATH